MTLLGKIFTVLILLMSLVFMSFALLVYMTTTNWRDEVTRTPDQTFSGEQVGLMHQLEEARQLTAKVEQERDEFRRQLELERAARQQTVPILESLNQTLLSQLQSKEAEIREHQAVLREKVAEFTALQTNLAALNSEVETLREEVRMALAERNAKFEEVLVLTDKYNQAEGVRRRLDERNQQLIAQIERMLAVLESVGADEWQPVPNVPPRDLDGIVLAVNDQKLVEISIGSDDGLQAGHFLEIFRGTTYVGRLIIRRADPDRAIGEVLKEWRRAPIQRGDTVAAKVS